jgi:DNA topoisomerase-1
MDGLTAKVFRTYNASITMQEELEKLTDEDATEADKVLAYNRANREVAVLCNHQRAVAKTHGDSVTKLNDKILIMKYDLNELRKALIQSDPSTKKKKDISDLDENIERCEELIALELEKKAATILEKMNNKLIEEGKDLLSELHKDDFPSRANIDHLSVDQLVKKIEKLENRIHVQKTQLLDREENKTTSLGTSKINYIDPRITAAWCAKHSVSLEKMFSKTLRSKFEWAMDVDETFIF